jgi:hypothetical protein
MELFPLRQDAAMTTRPTDPVEHLAPLRPADPDGPVDHALTLFLADETEAALRWGAAALERAPSAPGATLVTSRLLERMGRTRAAVEGLRLATRQAIERQDLPLAVVAIDDLRALGVDVTSELEEVAAAFCRESPFLQPASARTPYPELGDFQPLSPFLAGPALASKAAQILQESKRSQDDSAVVEKPLFAPLPLFGALSKPALAELLSAFKMITVPAGHRVVEEGQVVDEAYLVAPTRRKAASLRPALPGLGKKRPGQASPRSRAHRTRRLRW